jgi:hypothetical protein
MNAKPDAFVKEKFVGHLDHDAGAIAGVGFTTARTTVFHVFEHCQRIAYYLVGFIALDIRNESYAARVMLE